MEASPAADPAGNIVTAFGSAMEHEAGEGVASTRGRISRTPVSLDEGLLRQIRTVVTSTWTDKTTEELQGCTTVELTKTAKSLFYLKFAGQRKSISVSGSKAAVIGRILAWQEARKQGETTQLRKIRSAAADELMIGKKRRRSNSCHSEAASTPVVHAEGLDDDAVRHSTSRKKKQEAPLLEAQIAKLNALVRQAQASAQLAQTSAEQAQESAQRTQSMRLQADELSMAQRIRNTRELQALETDLLASIDKYEEMSEKGPIGEKIAKRICVMKERLDVVQKRLEKLFDF